MYQHDLPKYDLSEREQRLKTDEDKKKLSHFTVDIFNESIPIKDTIKTYFKLTKWPNTENNIAYKNATCAKVHADR